MGKQTMGFASQALHCRADQKLYHLQVGSNHYLLFCVFGRNISCVVLCASVGFHYYLLHLIQASFLFL